MSDIKDAIKTMIGKQPEQPEMVTISKEKYESLLDDQHKLECLEAAGVDNWQGYSDAMEMYREEDE
jgi:hypothetical protein